LRLELVEGSLQRLPGREVAVKRRASHLRRRGEFRHRDAAVTQHHRGGLQDPLAAEQRIASTGCSWNLCCYCFLAFCAGHRGVRAISGCARSQWATGDLSKRPAAPGATGDLSERPAALGATGHLTERPAVASPG